MREVLLRRDTRHAADHECVVGEAEFLAALLSVVAARTESLKVDTIRNHRDPSRLATEQLALRYENVSGHARFADDPGTGRLVANPPVETWTVDPLDDGGNARLLRRRDAVFPRVDEGDVDRVGAQVTRQLIPIRTARGFIALAPVALGSRLVVTNDERYAKTAEVIHKAAGPER